MMRNRNRLNGYQLREKKAGLEREMFDALRAQDVQGFEVLRKSALALQEEYGTRFGRVELRGKIEKASRNDRNLDLRGLNLSGLHLSDLKFYGANLDDLIVRDVWISNSVRFINSNLPRATFQNVVEKELRGAGLIIFMNSWAVDICFSNIVLMKDAPHSLSEPAGINFRQGCDFFGCKFKNVHLKDAQFNGNGLSAHPRDQRLKGCSFDNDCHFESLSFWTNGLNVSESQLLAAEANGLKNAMSDKEWARQCNLLASYRQF